MTTAAQTRESDTEPQASADRKQFVTFGLSGQSYCIDIMSVREIRILDHVTPVPGTPRHVRGVINLRGTIVPVVDVRIRFGEAETPLLPRQPAIIVSIAGRLHGLVVDVVTDIITTTPSELSAIPDHGSSRASTFFDGLVRHGDQMLIVVDLDRVIDGSSAELAM